MAGPIGADRIDYLFGMLASVIANSNRSKSSKPYRADQFIPKWDKNAPAERRPEMSPEEMIRAVKRANKAMGG